LVVLVPGTVGCEKKKYNRSGGVIFAQNEYDDILTRARLQKERSYKYEDMIR
jgi:hypothetical protein